MNLYEKMERLAYENEVLHARKVLETYFHNRVTDALYEDIGQVLSLIRLKLAQTATENSDTEQENRTQYSNLIAGIIGELRQFSRHLHADEETMVQEIFQMLQRRFETLDSPVSRDCLDLQTNKMVSEQRLIFCRMVVDTLEWVEKECGGRILAFYINCDQVNLWGGIHYDSTRRQGAPVHASLTNRGLPPIFYKRMARISGVLKETASNTTHYSVEFSIPNKPLFYG